MWAANTIGSGHTYYVLKSNSEIIARSTVTHLTEDEMIDTTDQRKNFDTQYYEIMILTPLIPIRTL